MIHHEAWFNRTPKVALERDLQRLQEEARRGDPDAIRKLRTLQERSNQHIEGEDDVNNDTEMAELLEHAKAHGYVPFLGKTVQELHRQLDLNASGRWFNFIEPLIFQSSDVLNWVLKAYDDDEHDANQLAPSKFFKRLWEQLEKLVQSGKIKDPHVVGWLFRHPHPWDTYPDIYQDRVLLAPDKDLPTINYKITYYDTQEGMDFWDNDGGNDETATLREFLTTFKDFSWDIEGRSGYPTRWALKGREESEQDEGGKWRSTQAIITFPHETEYIIRWLAKLMDPRRFAR